MHDIKTIRDNPQDFDAAMARRGLDAQSPAILEIDEKRRAVQTKLQDLQAARNEKSKSIGEIKKSGGDPSSPDGFDVASAVQAVMDEVAAIKDQMAALEEQDRALGEALNGILLGLPNILAEDVPDGADEDENVEIRTWGEPKVGDNAALEHHDIGEALGLMDFETAAKMSGSRFVVLKRALARMERALAQFFLDVHTAEHGYMEVSPPLVVRAESLVGTGQLPKFEEDQFQSKDSDHWMIPTSEVPLTNLVREQILEENEFPMRFTAFTPCFRKEAGSAGKDTRGMIRQHQFYKVEMVSVTKPEESAAEHERMTECAETILQKLELPYRTVTLCSGDTGFGAQKTYDIEVWLPGQGRYREISSCSNCGDFQARRMNARFKREGDPSSPSASTRQGKKTTFVHTLNGSGVAVGRALIAVIENYYDPADGGIFVPEALKPYMGGVEKILKTPV